MKDINVWLDRLSSLYKSEFRQAAANEGLQSVHLEILQYLSMSNGYSNTAQAVCEYLGQTKGSISQSLKAMEKEVLIARRPSERDKRVTKLFLTTKGEKALEEASKHMLMEFGTSNQDIEVLQNLLKKWQKRSGNKSYGQCKSCKYNQHLEDGSYLCGLTEEPLQEADIVKICREHEFKK